MPHVTIDSVLDLLRSALATLCGVPLYENAAHGLCALTDHRPKLDFVLGDIGERGVAERDVESIKPAVVIGDDDGRVDWFVGGLILDGKGKIDAKFSVNVEIAEHDSLEERDPSFGAYADNRGHQESPDQELSQYEELHRENSAAADENALFVPPAVVGSDESLEYILNFGHGAQALHPAEGLEVLSDCQAGD